MRVSLAALAVAGLLTICGSASPTTSNAQGLLAPEANYRAVISLVEIDDYVNARMMAQSLGDPLMEKYVRWVEAARPDAVVWFDDVVAFMRQAPGWPRQSTIRRNAESAMPADLPADYVRSYFATVPPQSGYGKVRYADALVASGETEKGVALVRDAWRTDRLDGTLEADILARYGGYLTRDDQLARLDRLLWDRQAAAARRQAQRVDRSWQLLAEARIKLFQRENGVDAAVLAVPGQLQNDPGLLYDRAAWRRVAGQFSGVVEILETTPTVGDADDWWSLRRWALQQALADGNVALAYRLAANHGQTAGRGFREGEWFAGWIALRQLNDPAAARAHFERFFAGVETPVSKSRGAYWAGRAAERAGDAGAAQRWFAVAASDATTFYGQIAAGRTGTALLPNLAPLPAPTAAERAAFDADEQVRLIRLLGAIGERRRTAPFIIQLATDATTPAQGQMIADLAIEQGHPNLSLWAARKLRTRDIILPERLFPVLDVAGNYMIDPALVLAVIRQESGFDTDAVSRAGARGLMQLMPGTAQYVSKRIGVDYSPGSLTTDPSYNMLLGQSYLAQMQDRYGSTILAVAAYNAGPGNVDKWLGRYGDPRAGRVDVIDWIESIPFEETQNYVHRVFEAMHVYNWRLDPSVGKIPLSQELFAMRQ